MVTRHVGHRVTIVMYHFVRDLESSRYPRIKGLDAREFAGQLEYIAKHYNVVRMENVIAATMDSGTDLPERPLLLTFDDGYADHYQTVFPLLDRLGMQGSFFPPARAIMERKVLDVNKIHFMLATADDATALVDTMEALLEEGRHDYDLETIAWYRKEYAHANRWDTAQVIYLKRMLQRGLPEGLRTAITDELFREFVTPDETSFAGELYMTLEQLKCMHRHGMHIGSHSYDHYWLDTLDESAQQTQVRKSLDFLREVGCNMSYWTMCYPYGGYNQSLLGVLEQNGCRLALTAEVAIAEINHTRRFELARIDTNHLPKTSNAPKNEWTRVA